MLLLMTITATCSLMVLAAVFVVLQKIQTGNPVPAEDVLEFSVERYRPMLRLLDESDFGLVAGFRGHSRQLRRFQAERRSIFRCYLRELRGDHGRIMGAIRYLFVESQIDRPDLAVAMYRCQFMFALAMASIEFKLLLHAAGIGTVDVKSLVAAVDGLQCQLQDMIFVRAVGCC